MINLIFEALYLLKLLQIFDEHFWHLKNVQFCSNFVKRHSFSFPTRPLLHFITVSTLIFSLVSLHKLQSYLKAYLAITKTRDCTKKMTQLVLNRLFIENSLLIRSKNDWVTKVHSTLTNYNRLDNPLMLGRCILVFKLSNIPATMTNFFSTKLCKLKKLCTDILNDISWLKQDTITYCISF